MAKILFVQELAQFHIGIAYLSAVLKKNGHECDLLIANLEKDFYKSIKAYKPDVLACSVITGNQEWFLKVAGKAKKSTKCKVIFGGPHPTFFPEIIEHKEIDYVCVGEGEYALLELANRIDRKEKTDDIPNIWSKNNGKIIKNPVRCLTGNLDELPFPDRDIFMKYKILKNSNQQIFITTRGCPYACTFCFNHALKKIYEGKGNYLRRRSVKNVLEELVHVKEKYGYKEVYFQDDTFVLDKKWIVELLKEYRKKINVPFVCLVRANLLDRKVVTEFKKSGCRCVYFGIETGNEQLRNQLLKKALYNKDIVRAAKLLHKYKIKFRTYNMLGLPDETLDNAFETLYLNVAIKTDYPWCSIFQPYPSTELGKYAIAKGYVSADFNENNFKSFYDKTLMSNKKDINQIINLQKFFIVAVKLPISIPLIKKLIKLPPNKFYDLIFILSYAYTMIGTEGINVFNSFGEGLRTIKKFYFGNGED